MIDRPCTEYHGIDEHKCSPYKRDLKYGASLQELHMSLCINIDLAIRSSDCHGIFLTVAHHYPFDDSLSAYSGIYFFSLL